MAISFPANPHSRGSAPLSPRDFLLLSTQGMFHLPGVPWMIILCFHPIICESLYNWDGTGDPVIQEVKIGREDSYMLQLRLSDVPVISVHRRVPKYQVYRYDQLIDFSEWSQLGFNLRSQLDRFKPETLIYHHDFVSDESFQFEYRFLKNLTHAECAHSCHLSRAHMPNSVAHVNDIMRFQPKVFNYFWVQLNQTANYAAGKNKYVYQLKFDGKEIFPTNKMKGSTVLYQFSKGSYGVVNPSQLRSRTSYYDFTSGQYYHQEPYTLNARASEGSNFQILIPLHSNSFHPSFSRSTCICQRTVRENTKNAITATQMAKLAKSSIYDTPATFESLRVRAESATAKSPDVNTLLSKVPKPYQAGHPFEVLMKDDILPLLLAPLSPARNVSGFSLSRPQRAAPVFLATVAKTILSQAIAITSPYILEESKNIFQSLVKKASVQLAVPSWKRTTNDNVTYQQDIDEHFSASPADATLLHDRLVLSVKDSPQQLVQVSTPNVELATIMEQTAKKLEIFRDRVITSLPKLLLDKVLASLPHPVRPNSQIVMNVKKSLSFYVFSYYIECRVDTYTFTNVSAFPMPFIQEDKTYFTVRIPENSLSMNDGNSHWLDTFATLQAEECAQIALSSQPTNLLPFCQREKFVPQIMTVPFQMDHGIIILMLGPSVLTLSCVQKASQIITFSAPFNLIYVNNACDFKLTYYHVTKVMKASKDQIIGADYQHLLTLSIPGSPSTSSRTYYWMLTITILVASILGALCIIALVVLYCRYKYRPKLVVTPDGTFECSLVNFESKLDNVSHEIPFIDNTEHPLTAKESARIIVDLPKDRAAKPASH